MSYPKKLAVSVESQFLNQMEYHEVKSKFQSGQHRRVEEMNELLISAGFSFRFVFHSNWTGRQLFFYFNRNQINSFQLRPKQGHFNSVVEESRRFWRTDQGNSLGGCSFGQFVCVSVYVCMCVYMYVCMCVCVLVRWSNKIWCWSIRLKVTSAWNRVSVTEL